MSCVIECKNCGKYYGTTDLKPHVCDKYKNVITRADGIPDVPVDDGNGFSVIFDPNEPSHYYEREEVAKEMTQASARYNSGKVQVREVDPNFILGIGEVLTASRDKYEEGNWMRETKFSTPYESCMRHLMKFWSGQEMDEETKKHHLLHAATNIMFLYYHQDSGKGIDDRLFKKEKK